MHPQPTLRDLVLIGAGHSHAIALKLFGMNPIPGVQITLITETTYTPYSGMLPGYVAGYYSVDDCHIDMRPLAQFANARLYLDRAIGLDLENQTVRCANRPPVPYDVLSINIGSIPTKANVPGAEKYAIPAKPIRHFLEHWQQVVKNITRQPDRPWRLAIVGGGVGGVELSLNMRSRLHGILKQAGQPTSNLTIHLFQRGRKLAPDLNAKARQILLNNLLRQGIEVHLEQTAIEVQPNRVLCQSGLAVDCDRIFWVTQASAQPWLAAAGLATDKRGFIALKDTLQSESHPNVFAAGDISAVTCHPRPKAGVFAVRQGKPLYDNLRRHLLGEASKPFKPQQDFLRIVGTGNKSAVATKWNWAWQSPLMWRWKEWIEFRFMGQFRNLDPMPASDRPALPQGMADPETIGELSNLNMRCGGCGSKVGSTVLSRVLQRLQLELGASERSADILVGLDSPDDAAILQVPTDQAMVQTLDYFKTLLDDPYLFGQIATHHCLSDLFAMGATGHSALALATLPYASEEKAEDTLFQLLAGATEVLREAGAQLIGGHTVEGAELGFGLTCNGFVRPDRILRKSGLKPDRVLLVTKAIGTGALFAAHMRLRADGRWIDAAVQSMLQSNRAAALCLQRHGATACTDITGFGLLGHLLEMVEASGVSVQLDLSGVPILPGAIDVFQSGTTSSLHPQNARAARAIRDIEAIDRDPRYPVLFDPQTSGGLLAAVDVARASGCLAELHSLGYEHSSIIGCVVERDDNLPPIQLRAL
ncbi:selenide, water dikinase SelD [Synechococcus sp. PCC 7336]|uniref:selenide, water dikinase SelD n=1 Tax=Synechococcus sp. PCC 7336 TaxID=195250 RepID=UPI00034DE99D|nr:selenide, water dikinase SelD [Synechococcus sp. PCC 7336]